MHLNLKKPKGEGETSVWTSAMNNNSNNWLIEGEKRQKKEKEGRKEGKKEGVKKEKRGFYVKGRQQKWANTATDEGAQRLRSERPV